MRLEQLILDPGGEAEVTQNLVVLSGEIATIIDHHNQSRIEGLHLVQEIDIIVKMRDIMMNIAVIIETKTTVVSRSAIDQDQGHQRKEEVGIEGTKKGIVTDSKKALY